MSLTSIAELFSKELGVCQMVCVSHLGQEIISKALLAMGVGLEDRIPGGKPTF